MTDPHRLKLCYVGVAKLCVSAVMLAVAGLLLAFDTIDRTAGLSLLSLGAGVGVGGHTLCQLCCLPLVANKKRPPTPGPH